MVTQSCVSPLVNTLDCLHHRHRYICFIVIVPGYPDAVSGVHVCMEPQVRPAGLGVSLLLVKTKLVVALAFPS